MRSRNKRLPSEQFSCSPGNGRQPDAEHAGEHIPPVCVTPARATPGEVLTVRALPLLEGRKGRQMIPISPRKVGTSSLLIVLSLTFNTFEAATTHLLYLADRAQIGRRMDVLDVIIKTLDRLPLTQTQGQSLDYYRAVAGLKRGEPAAIEKLIKLSTAAPHSIRARACMTLGADSVRRGDLKTADEMYVEGLKLAHDNDYAIRAFLTKNRATLRILEGDGQGAMKMMESVLPLASHLAPLYPTFYLDSLNTVACDLLTLGRASEALPYARAATASPLAKQFPEWTSTLTDAQRSVCTARILPTNNKVLQYKKPNNTPSQQVQATERGKVLPLIRPEKNHRASIHPMADVIGGLIERYDDLGLVERVKNLLHPPVTLSK